MTKKAKILFISMSILSLIGLFSLLNLGYSALANLSSSKYENRTVRNGNMMSQLNSNNYSDRCNNRNSLQ